MNIKKLLKGSLIFVIPFIIIVYFLYCINILSKDFSYGHKSHNFNPGPVKWVSYNLSILKFKFKNIIFNKNYKVNGLNRIDLFIPEKTSRKLLENVPSSTKKYLRSNLLTKKYFRVVGLLLTDAVDKPLLLGFGSALYVGVLLNLLEKLVAAI